jgi:hypothetical protein
MGKEGNGSIPCKTNKSSDGYPSGDDRDTDNKGQKVCYKANIL